ncbi:undecaprenyl-phosphate glucose phosphotransferase [candidate division KSB1 bacterium]|nr:undecaprenyl-phosphate glucose phosphotransferase [candidate division KSB1 bacterium]
MLKLTSRSQKFILIFGDLLLTALAFYLAFWLRFESGIWRATHTDRTQYLIVLACILPLWPGLFSFFRLYISRRHQGIFADFLPLLYSISTGVVFVSAFTFFYREISYSRLTFLLFGGLNFAFLFVERVVLRIALQMMRKRGYNLRRVLIVGAGELGRRVAQRMLSHPEMGFQVVGFLDDFHANGVYKKELGLEVLGKLGSVSEIVEAQQIDKVIIALPIRALHKVERVVTACEKEGVSTDIVPDLFNIVQPRTRVYDFAGLPLISVRFTPIESWGYRIGKRGFDIAFAASALLLCAPLLAIIALAVKLTSPGPIIFKQERIGINRKRFNMLKFRSMSAGSEKHDQQAGLGSRNDPRVTFLGGFLRRWSLDELPQFWNVLRGDMSIVGPRPERTYHVHQFKTQIPNYMIRHQVKAGITGWAQVNGLRGDTSITERLEHDLYYIENWSFGFDLKIILLTLFKGMVNENA